MTTGNWINPVNKFRLIDGAGNVTYLDLKNLVAPKTKVAQVMGTIDGIVFCEGDEIRDRNGIHTAQLCVSWYRGALNDDRLREMNLWRGLAEPVIKFRLTDEFGFATYLDLKNAVKPDVKVAQLVGWKDGREIYFGDKVHDWRGSFTARLVAGWYPGSLKGSYCRETQYDPDSH